MDVQKNASASELLHLQKAFWKVVFEQSKEKLILQQGSSYEQEKAITSYLYEDEYLYYLEKEINVPESWRKFICNLSNATFETYCPFKKAIFAMEMLGYFHRSLNDLWILYLHYGAIDEYCYGIEDIVQITQESEEMVWDKICTMKHEIRVKRKAHAI